MAKRKKKRKLKKQYKIILIILLVLGICTTLGYHLLKSEEEPNSKENKIDPQEIITEILAYQTNTNIETKFLEWINEKYGTKTLTKINQTLKDNTYQNSVWHEITNKSLFVLLDEYNGQTQDRTFVEESTNSETTISFIGDVSLADNWYIMPKYDERNKKVYGILSEDVVDIMTTSNIMVANNEFTISDRGEKMPNKYYTFRASPSRLSIYQEMGVDLVTLANNHIYDFGETAFYDSLEALNQYNIPYIGAGRNMEEAKKPYYFIANGYKIAFVNATRAEKYILTPEATETSGGVLRCYDPTAFIELIQETKKNSDYVITLVHWGTEDTSKLETVQEETSKLYIDAGADIIVGTHAHTLQGIDFYNNKAIIYNLGDFIFNNETKDTGIFQLKLTSEGELKYQFIPCKEENEYTYLLKDDEKQRVLDKMQNLSPNITMTETGEFYVKTS